MPFADYEKKSQYNNDFGDDLSIEEIEKKF